MNRQFQFLWSFYFKYKHWFWRITKCIPGRIEVNAFAGKSFLRDYQQHSAGRSMVNVWSAQICSHLPSNITKASHWQRFNWKMQYLGKKNFPNSWTGIKKKNLSKKQCIQFLLGTISVSKLNDILSTYVAHIDSFFFFYVINSEWVALFDHFFFFISFIKYSYYIFFSYISSL